MAKAAKDSSNMINLVFYERVRQYYRLAFGVWCILLSQNTFGENESDYKNKIVNVASWLWGNPLPTQINFDPLGYHFFDDHLRMYTVDSNLCITKVQDSYWVFEIEPLRKNVKYFYKIDDMIGVRELFRRLSL